ncbi:MAG: hypothetical protein A2099_02795 [Planctomycetes bacterium GWF2_39_10]|nr:MAG: hypothetical protein A2Y09_04400 [Planctomycetes bacterium GWA2_39_15]OHB43318.1 MAG: hypothetical protein A2Y11_00210 [Planctomycetes bacterium GWC2_39_26]OHB52357.1 MAG: hypothetical protein A2099_02795 [Planctomycetes bacterium GWF2_39_10]
MMPNVSVQSGTTEPTESSFKKNTQNTWQMNTPLAPLKRGLSPLPEVDRGVSISGEFANIYFLDSPNRGLEIVSGMNHRNDIFF